MVADSELQLRDFDGETEDSDSETELLIRHSGRSGARQPAKRGSIATSRYYLHDYSTTQPTAATSSSSSLSATNIATGFFSNLFGNTTNSLGRAAGQVRLRNERSRERDKYAASRARTQQLQEQQQQYQQQQARTTALSFGGFNTGLGTSAKLAKLAQATQTSYRGGGGGGATSGVDVAAHGVTESVALGVRSSSQSGAHKRYDATGATSATSESASGGGGMGGGAGVVLQQTVLDAENGSTTVYYQKNRRRSKRKSLANLCKMCLCGWVSSSYELQKYSISHMSVCVWKKSCLKKYRKSGVYFYFPLFI